MQAYNKAKRRLTIFIFISAVLLVLSIMWLSVLKAKGKQAAGLGTISIGNYKVGLNIQDSNVVVNSSLEGTQDAIVFLDKSTNDSAVVNFITDANSLSVFFSETQQSDIGYNCYLCTTKYGNSDYYYLVVKVRDDLYYLVSGLNITSIENIFCAIQLSIDGNEYKLGTDLSDILNNVSTTVQDNSSTITEDTTIKQNVTNEETNMQEGEDVNESVPNATTDELSNENTAIDDDSFMDNIDAGTTPADFAAMDGEDDGDE